MQEHFEAVAQAIVLRSKVIPVLGAGVNVAGRPPDARWEKDAKYLPDGRELAGYLATRFRYPGDDGRDLMRVSQYVTTMQGDGPLYDELHDVFAPEYPPGPLHRFLASLPALLRRRGLPHQLILTTNYDTALERAFADAGEQVDVTVYIASGEERGRFWHVPPAGAPILIESPNDYSDLSTDVRTVIVKIHGGVDRSLERELESFVITEDDYIDYLTHTEPLSLFPVRLAALLNTSHLLFLGYGMRDWNLRVILHRLWREQRRRYASWAVQLRPEPIELKFWSKRSVDILDAELDEYVDRLSQRVTAVADSVS
jgi:hypothetical protein